MELTKDIHQAMSIASRYERLHYAAQVASDALGKVKLELFSDLISLQEEATIRAAERIIDEIRSNTGCYDAQNYYKKLNHE